MKGSQKYSKGYPSLFVAEEAAFEFQHSIESASAKRKVDEWLNVATVIEPMEDGLKDGRDVGLQDGPANGLEDGLKDGRADGVKDGLANGVKDGWANGVKDG